MRRRRSTGGPFTTCSVMLSADDRRFVEELGERYHVSVSWVVEQALVKLRQDPAIFLSGSSGNTAIINGQRH